MTDHRKAGIALIAGSLGGILTMLSAIAHSMAMVSVLLLFLGGCGLCRMQHMARDVPAAAHQWQIVIDSTFQINQSFSRSFSVSASAAIFLWSVAALRKGGSGRAVGVFGCVVSILTIVAIAVGHLSLNVHGMMVIALTEAIWFVIVGIKLLSRSPAGSSTFAPA